MSEPKKLKCPYCHSIKVKAGVKGSVEAGKWMQRTQQYEVAANVRQVICTLCTKDFYINDRTPQHSEDKQKR